MHTRGFEPANNMINSPSTSSAQPSLKCLPTKGSCPNEKNSQYQLTYFQFWKSWNPLALTKSGNNDFSGQIVAKVTLHILSLSCFPVSLHVPQLWGQNSHIHLPWPCDDLPQSFCCPSSEALFPSVLRCPTLSSLGPSSKGDLPQLPHLLSAPFWWWASQSPVFHSIGFMPERLSSLPFFISN